jgi:hypothetical protein
MPYTRNELAQSTLEALSLGVTNSAKIRDWIAGRLGIHADSRFVNTHAWALVDLQRRHEIEKISRQEYRLVRHAETHEIAPPAVGAMPTWARALLSRAKSRNGPDGPIFSEADLLDIWNHAKGRCAVTGLPFSDQRIGTGKAKRVFAPSLDRLDGERPYGRGNCRLVMVGINFAMNRWGLDTYLLLARAAVAFSGREQSPNFDGNDATS